MIPRTRTQRGAPVVDPPPGRSSASRDPMAMCPASSSATCGADASFASSFARHPVAVNSRCAPRLSYSEVVPRLWKETIEEHRRGVHNAILDTTWSLVSERGLRSVTMSQIAEQTGIGRATLYKYFPDVESILLAWHQRHVYGHLKDLAEIRDRRGDAGARLEAVLEAYGLICHYREHHRSELVALLHRGQHAAQAHQQLVDLIRDLLIEVREAGDLRDDVAPDELASYCLHALAAASSLPSKAAVRRLVTVIITGLRRGRDGSRPTRRPPR